MSTTMVNTNTEGLTLKSWKGINWKIVESKVRNLRRRIFQAKIEGNYRNLRSLQRLLLKSYSNILLSIRKVSANSGGKTPGTDGFTISNERDKLDLFHSIAKNGYMGQNPKPIKRIYIQEPTKKRPIGIPTVYDRTVQMMVKNSLEPEWEVVFEKGSYGFRPERNVNDAVSRLWLALNKEGSRKWIVDSDISKCFDSISHDYLMEQLEGFVGYKLIYLWLKNGIITRGVWMDSGDEGTPQGSVLSPLLCNIALHGLEKELGVKYKSKKTVSTSGRLLIRYADDLVILCKSKLDADHALETLKLSLVKRGLSISEAKTRVTHIVEGFDFLGFNFIMKSRPHVPKYKVIHKIDNENYRIDSKGVALYISPSEKSFNKIKDKLRQVKIRYASHMTRIFIKKLNEVLRGYIQSKWHWHSGNTFSKLNFFVYYLCLRWAKRRHPDKSTKWIVGNYFCDLSLNNIKSKWVFYARHSNKPTFNRIDHNFVYKTFWFKIRRYYKAQMDKLPDRKEDQEYFKQLKINRYWKRPLNILFREDRQIALSQYLLCPICGNGLNFDDEVHRHHIIPKKEGGKLIFSNTVILHKECHIEVHRDYRLYKEILMDYRKKHPRLNVKSLLKLENDYE